ATHELHDVAHVERRDRRTVHHQPDRFVRRQARGQLRRQRLAAHQAQRWPLDGPRVNINAGPQDPRSPWPPGGHTPEKCRGVDYYGIEELLSEEERMIRDAVRDWVEAEFLPIVAEHHRAGTFPVELFPKLGELGVFGATLTGYGCAGLNNVAYGLIMQ